MNLIEEVIWLIKGTKNFKTLTIRVFLLIVMGLLFSTGFLAAIVWSNQEAIIEYILQDRYEINVNESILTRLKKAKLSLKSKRIILWKIVEQDFIPISTTDESNLDDLEPLEYDIIRSKIKLLLQGDCTDFIRTNNGDFISFCPIFYGDKLIGAISSEVDNKPLLELQADYQTVLWLNGQATIR